MAKFTKRPEEVEAWRWDNVAYDQPDWMREAFKSGVAYYQGGPEPYVTINLNGNKQRAQVGDYIVRDFQREFIVMKREEFEATFAPMQEKH